MATNQWNSGVNDRSLKELICEIGRRVYNKGFAAANDGNISIRVGENAVLCSPTMICKGFMKPEDICAVDMEGNQIAGILENDAKVNKMVADLYANYVKTPKDAQTVTHDGGFMEWAYFHYGRFGFSTPGWRTPAWEIPTDSLEKLKFKPNTDKNTDVNFLRWAADAKLSDYFVPWTKVDHPGFPGQPVEVGGIAPFVQLNPPYREVESLIEKHSRFVIDLARQKPNVELIQVRSQKLDNGLWRVEATVFNAGKMPTTSQIGDQLRWLKYLRVDLNLARGQQLISGQKVNLFPGLEAGGARKLSWLIQGPGQISIRAAAPHCGQDTSGIDLK